MDKKQLNFNVPLLSVRRVPSALASLGGDNGKRTENSQQTKKKSLSSYQSDFDLGEVVKPATVPFLWERIPGRAKLGTDSQPQPPKEPANTPRLPPGRAMDVKRQLSGELSKVQNVIRAHNEEPSLNDIAALLESLSKGINSNADSDLESRDDAYSDAVDTLSSTESFSFNCSASGLSGYDGPDLKPSGTFDSDPQTRDFLMSRFLPAAKAMVLDMPQYVPRKQPVSHEQPRQTKKVLNGEGRPLLEQYGSTVIPHYDQHMEDVESEDGDEEFDDFGNRSTKACGLIPRVCLNNSLCLLNPVPGMKMRTPSPMSSRPTRTAYSGPLPQVVNKHAWDTANKKTHDSSNQSNKLLEFDNKRIIGESNRLTYSSDLHLTDESSPYRRSISPYRNFAPQSLFSEGAGFLGVPKVVETVKPKSFKLSNKGSNKFLDVSPRPPYQRYKPGSGSVSPTVEKMLYIDSVNELEPISSEPKGVTDSSGEDLKTLVEEETAKEEFSFQDIRFQNIFEGGSILKPKASVSTKADLSSSALTSDQRCQAGRIEGSKQDTLDLKCQADKMEELRRDQSLNQVSQSSEFSKVYTSGNLDMKNEHNLKADGLENSNGSSFKSPLQPPLPKSPSESWLWRALPSISSQSSFSHSLFRPKRQGPETSSTGTKWETIVKTSNLHYDRVRYSQELIPHASQHSKTEK
ncbi:uncharacterized protein LOC132309982 [Cornus florida]|uniref:uncharacterized protein LOC132309982 n=1 Tax=Cornus florida TaxID=4283 RepID=UPI00289E3A14|nr:uncharacterized protein LOC132309982 [Cornus florida]XP_059664218.1 uncharacterized protein LOC132309982 [Cornus florida]XP_059664224.1 uncharacterized protein LOC132309982 [Cornus florida]XP_059664230.1 uncharacterized protein LOC132309982 [Cornus florida]XP_059664234.1 uncharacterized protein LOC132309982 [Cornus florida]